MLRLCSSGQLRRGLLKCGRGAPFVALRGNGNAPTVVPSRQLSGAVSSAREPTELDNVTTLSNGIRVASEALPGPFSGVGVYIDAGSRHENDYLRGASHIMDRLAFKSTDSRSSDEMLETLEELGGNIQCASSRESMMYQAATFNAAVPTTVGLLADTIRNPRLTDSEISQQLETAQYEINEIWSKPDLILPELVHTAAFKDNTLGNPLLCPQERLAAINRDVISAYRELFYRPERMVVAFAGIPHVDAVELTEQFFGDMRSAVQAAGPSVETHETDLPGVGASSSAPTTASTPAVPAASAPRSSPPSWNLLSKISTRSLFKNRPSSPSDGVLGYTPSSSSGAVDPLLPLEPAHYTGGFLALPPQPPPLNPNLPTFSHIQLAFEGLPILASDIYALATLQTLLGGGGSFSAGGPGKGMYSRLYTNVLNQHGFVESCVAFNHSYADSGLFGIAASCSPGRTSKMLEIMCRELHALTLDSGSMALRQAEVDRAKNQLRSSLLMNLESRIIELEDLGRQVQVHGRKVPVREMTRRISALTISDLRDVARRVFGGLIDNPGHSSGAPTVVVQEASVSGGITTKQLTWEEIQDMLFQWRLGRR